MKLSAAQALGPFFYGEANHRGLATKGPGCRISSKFKGRGPQGALTFQIQLIQSTGFVPLSMTVTNCLRVELTFWNILNDRFRAFLLSINMTLLHTQKSTLLNKTCQKRHVIIKMAFFWTSSKKKNILLLSSTCIAPSGNRTPACSKNVGLHTTDLILRISVIMCVYHQNVLKERTVSAWKTF